MLRVASVDGVSVSYDKYGVGPSLVLVHGGFSDHRTNWEFVKPLFEKQFTVYAIARRGRGETDATEDHSLEDESVGTESPRDFYVTDGLARVLPDPRIEELRGQAHEAMTTAPELYAEAVSRFLLS
jgi:pimeloyl-ACP methyl ester carboxylesterase